jgi:hypothetical protein
VKRPPSSSNSKTGRAASDHDNQNKNNTDDDAAGVSHPPHTAATPPPPTTTTTVHGCMFRPTSPVKLFATLQDEELRKILKDSSSSNSSNDDADHVVHQHWSMDHCWTLREMMGLDRMSGIYEETNSANVNAAASCGGMDFVLITTYLLDVDFLISELPELVDCPTTIIVYHYKNPRYDVLFFQQQGPPSHCLTLSVSSKL